MKKKVSGWIRPPGIELLIIAAVSSVIFIISAEYDFLEKIIEYAHKYEEYELDEIISIIIFLSFGMSIFTIRRWISLAKIENPLIEKNRKQETLLKEIKQLKKILPICSSCKKIRDEKGHWHQIDSYISSHFGTEFTHSICPGCIEKLYPEYRQKHPVS